MFRVSLIFLWLVQCSLQKLETCATVDENELLSPGQMRMVCMHRQQWLRDRDTHASKAFVGHTSDLQAAYLRRIELCTRENCVRDARRKKRTASKSIRKEIRMMSPEELEDLGRAMNALKSRVIDNITAWDLHTLVHYPDSAPGAHWGPAFLPWHREFLRQFEIALQTEVPTVTLPYWDSTLDQGLPEESDSVLWTDELMGNGNGYVKTGPFKDWSTNVFMPLSQVPVKRLYRSTGGREHDRLMTPRDVDWIVTRKNYSQLTFCHDKTFESMHGLSHVWVGGFMFVIRVSPNDPTFYMHHAFVDYLWEQFRRNSQTREERESQWAKKTCNDNHGFDVQMKPFTIQNRDGLSNQYTDEWYEYQPVRHCTPDEPTCESPYYWCDQKLWRCRSKVVYGGNCTGYEGSSICYNSVCSKGECVVPPRVRSAMKSRMEEETVPWNDVVWTKTMFLDAVGQGIDDEMAHVVITDLDTNHTTTVFSFGSTSYPELPGTVYLSIPKPLSGMTTQVLLEARDQHGRYCQAQCFNTTIERYQVCQPTLKIGFRTDSSSPIAYTHSMSSRRFLDVDLSLHPRQPAVSPPYIVFACARKLVTSAMIMATGERLRPPVSTDELVWFRVAVHRSPSQNVQIEATPSVGEPWSSSIQKAASSFDPNIVFVQAPNPEINRGGVRVKVSILEDGQRISCIVKCTARDGSVKTCDGEVELHSDPSRSEEDVFTTDASALPVLGWNMKGHPTQWRHRMPYLSFTC
ncbi:unnamed protein product [Caenorhabditis auriculariae]|uniref:Tyrosinase copper-binding domain-containing protein n=1 Tax=Caenorhabditis auriculariae TaxID=2777116 RepID=A0A8S1H740_9PELO|nr:unnamed protein product [Caenorhabditis auriculariae]